MAATAAAFVATSAREASRSPISSGSAGFHGHSILVDRNVLVPRPETEHMVDDAIVHLISRDGVRALDLGTGRGAIACRSRRPLRAPWSTGPTSHPKRCSVAIGTRTGLGSTGRCSFIWAILRARCGASAYDVDYRELAVCSNRRIAAPPDRSALSRGWRSTAAPTAWTCTVA